MNTPPPAETEALVLSTWNFDDARASAQRFEQVAAGHPSAGVLLTQRARAIGLTGDLGAASAALDSIEIDPLDDHLGARIAIERGRIANSSGDPSTAQPYFAEAESRARAAGLPGLAIDAVHMQAIVAGGLGNHREAEELVRAALEEASVSADPATRRWRASLLNNLGWTLADTDRWALALTVFEQAAELRREAGSGLLPARWAVARALRAVGRLDEARVIQRELALQDPADEYVRAELDALGQDD